MLLSQHNALIAGLSGTLLPSDSALAFEKTGPTARRRAREPLGQRIRVGSSARQRRGVLLNDAQACPYLHLQQALAQEQHPQTRHHRAISRRPKRAHGFVPAVPHASSE